MNGLFYMIFYMLTRKHIVYGIVYVRVSTRCSGRQFYLYFRSYTRLHIPTWFICFGLSFADFVFHSCVTEFSHDGYISLFRHLLFYYCFCLIKYIDSHPGIMCVYLNVLLARVTGNITSPISYVCMR